MQAVVQKWGNSLGLRIPAAVAERKRLTAGSKVELVEEEDHIVIQPEPEPTLESLLAQVKPENRPDLANWGPSRGKEVW